MIPFRYPHDEDAPDTYLENVHWLAVPVCVKDSIANCYLSGTGIANFTDDPQWDFGVGDIPIVPGTFRLRFISQSPLTSEDVFVPGVALATVGLGRINRNTDYGDDRKAKWLMALETVEVTLERVEKNGYANQENQIIRVDITSAVQGDCWTDKIAFQIGLLVYRPSFLKPQPKFIPRHIRVEDMIGRAESIHG